MKVQIERSFSLPGSVAAAWSVLSDVERVAGCMPGASITERVADDRYKGAIAVKFGPASMSFRGEVTVLAIDPATRTVRLAGKGTDSTGSSGASMDLTASIEPEDGAASCLKGTSEVMVSGKAAAFGSRMMSSVAEQVLRQFGDNFATQVHAAQEAQAAAAAAAPAYIQAPPPAPARELNGLALAWAAFKDWLRSLFTAKRA